MAELFSLLLSEFGDLIASKTNRDRIAKEFIDACEHHGVTFTIDDSKFPSDSDIKKNEEKKESVKEMEKEEQLVKQAAKDKPDNFTNMHSQVMKDKNVSFKEGLKDVK